MPLNEAVTGQVIQALEAKIDKLINQRNELRAALQSIHDAVMDKLSMVAGSEAHRRLGDEAEKARAAIEKHGAA